MRMSDLSSDVCSSALLSRIAPAVHLCEEGACRRRSGSGGLCRGIFEGRGRRRLSGSQGADRFAQGRVGRRQCRGEGHDAARWNGAEIKTQGSPFRSEEHTSELQSLMRISYAVFCLQKKKSL